MEAESLVIKALGNRQYRKIEVFKNGWNSVAAAIDRQYIVKIARRPEFSSKIESEFNIVGSIRKFLRFRIPYPLEKGNIDGCSFALYDFIDGAVLCPDSLQVLPEPCILKGIKGKAKEKLEFQLSEITSDILGIVPKSLVVEGIKNHGTPEAFASSLRSMIKSIAPGYLDQNEIRVIDDRLELLDDLVSLDTGTSRFVHGDLGSWNMIYSNGGIAGIIDWGEAGIGDPAIDMMEIIYSFGEESARRIYSWNPEMENIFARASSYLWFSGFFDMEYGIKLGDADLVERGLKVVRKKIQES